MNKKILSLIAFSLSTLLAPLSVLATEFVPDIGQNESKVIAAETVFFFGHSTSFWDGGKTLPTVRKMIALADQHKVLKIATVADTMLKSPEVEMHHFKQSEMNHLVASRAGQHRLEFPNTKSVFVMGGNLGRCLCEGIRDIVRGWVSSSKNQSMTIFMIRDGIYNNYPAFTPMPFHLAAEFTQRFFVPSFNCPLQNWFDLPRMNLNDTKIRLLYDNLWIQDFDLEPNDSIPLEALQREIVVHFIDSTQAVNFLGE